MSRYQVGEAFTLVGSFVTGRTVTIALYNAQTGSAISLSSSSCTEIGSTGTYRWPSSNLSSAISSYTEVIWIMTDGTSGAQEKGFLAVGGYVDFLDDSVADLAADVATVDGNVDSILTDTDTTIPGLIAALNDLDATEVQTAAAAALTAYDPPTKAEMDAAFADVPRPTTGPLIRQIGESYSIVGRFPTGGTVTIAVYNVVTGSAVTLSSNSCTEIGSTGLYTFPSSNITGLVNQHDVLVWQMTDGTTTAAGTIEVDPYILQGITGLSTEIANSEAAIIAQFQIDLGNLNDVSAGQVADAVWDEALSSHPVPGSAGVIVSGILEDTGTTLPAQITSEINDVQTDIGNLNDLDATEVQTAAAAALTAYDPPTKAELDTAQSAIQSDIAGLNDLDATAVQAAATAALTAYDPPTKAELDAAQGVITTAIAALNDLDATAVAAAILDAARSSHTTAGTVGHAFTLLLNHLASRGAIDVSQSPWQEVRYVFDELSAGDTSVFERFDLYDQNGSGITNANNPLVDPTKIIAERRRV